MLNHFESNFYSIVQLLQQHLHVGQHMQQQVVGYSGQCTNLSVPTIQNLNGTVLYVQSPSVTLIAFSLWRYFYE